MKLKSLFEKRAAVKVSHSDAFASRMKALEEASKQAPRQSRPATVFKNRRALAVA